MLNLIIKFLRIEGLLPEAPKAVNRQADLNALLEAGQLAEAESYFAEYHEVLNWDDAVWGAACKPR